MYDQIRKKNRCRHNNTLGGKKGEYYKLNEMSSTIDSFYTRKKGEEKPKETGNTEEKTVFPEEAVYS